MATLSMSFTIPDAQQTEVIDTLARGLGWQDGDALGKGAHIKQAIKSYLKSVRDQYLTDNDGVAASDAAVTAKSDLYTIDD